MDSIVIVGAGTVGASLAWYLARDGVEVTLVDQFEPGDRRATSGGETRLIRCGHGDDPGYTASARRFNQSRAVAIDMESATVAAQGYRFRVPYGTLLCVSDKPLHGELKLPGQANAFYERRVVTTLLRLLARVHAA